MASPRGRPVGRPPAGLLQKISGAGLLGQAISQARERVRQVLIAAGLALPARGITVSLVPADLAKRIHGGLPIALGQMVAIGHCAGRVERLRGVRRTRARWIVKLGDAKCIG